MLYEVITPLDDYGVLVIIGTPEPRDGKPGLLTTSMALGKLGILAQLMNSALREHPEVTQEMAKQQMARQLNSIFSKIAGGDGTDFRAECDCPDCTAAREAAKAGEAEEPKSEEGETFYLVPGSNSEN